MSRRIVPALSGVAVALMVTAAGPLAVAQSTQMPAAAAHTATFELYIDEVYDQLTGGDVVFSVAFRDPFTRKLNPLLNVREGDAVAIKLTNRTARPRSFAIMSVPGTASVPIRAGASMVVRFKAPPKGHYTYYDPTQSKLPETRSLFGDLMVLAK